MKNNECSKVSKMFYFLLAIARTAEYLLYGEQWSEFLADFSCSLYCSIPAALQSLLKKSYQSQTVFCQNSTKDEINISFWTSSCVLVN